MARPSSYASVLAGNARSGIYSSSVGGMSTTNSHSYPIPNPTGSSRDHQPHSRSYSGPLHTVNTFERDNLPPYSSSLGGKWYDSFGGTVVEPRIPPPFLLPSYLRNSRHAERLEVKHKALVQAQREDANRASSVSLSRSGSGMNLHKMVPSHRGMTYEIQENFVSNPEDVVPPLPTRWSSKLKFAGLEVSSSGTEVKLPVNLKSPGGENEAAAAAILTDNPIPKACGIYYFEVTVLGKGKDAPVGVGLSGPKVSLQRPPGWESESYAYHGDDGQIFSQSPSGKEWGSKFGHADIIGCGIVFKTGNIFFTKNGVYLDTAFRDVKADTLYPTVGLKKNGDHVRINLGATPFVFDIDGMVAREKESLQEQIAAEDTSSLHPKETESDMLQRLVGQYLAHEGYTEATKAFAKEVKTVRSLLHGVSPTAPPAFEYSEDLDAVNRQGIRSAILDGDVDKALKYTMAHYPSVLQENENIYFKLRCRKFIEMMKKTVDLQPRARRTNSSSNSLRRRSSKSLGGGGGANRFSHTYSDDHPDVFSGQMELDPPPTTFSPTEMAIVDEAPSPLPADTLSKQADLMASALAYGRELQAEFKDDPRREVKQALEDTFALIAYPDARDSSLAHLLENEGRVPVAEELNSAILVSLGQSSSAALERLASQAEVLTQDLGAGGGAAALVNIKKDYMR